MGSNHTDNFGHSKTLDAFQVNAENKLRQKQSSIITNEKQSMLQERRDKLDEQYLRN